MTDPLVVEPLHFGSLLPRISPAARGVAPSAPGTRVDEGSGHTAFEHALERVLAPTNAAPTDVVSMSEGDESVSSINFSRHALGRLESRGIELTEEDLDELSSAVDRLSEKDARESLLLFGDHAFIVGVPKRTIITAMTRKEAMGSVFTNIDSAMVLR